MNPMVVVLGLLAAAALLERHNRKKAMHNCSDDVLGFHDDEVTLPKSERDEMRARRNANRDRLKDGLKESEKPLPREFKSQGSYAMRTMTRDPDKHYDIDDGVYFEKAKLVGARGAEMSPLEARQMVRDGVDDGSFNTAPEVRPNCVRVHYDAGYHVDLPVYRRVETKDWFGETTVHYELAGAEWKRSDARDVTAWFEKENDEKSPNKENGGQLRRITRDVKKFAKSRPSWRGQVLSGFGITVLVTECYHADSNREDVALYETMRAMKERLDLDLVVKHPVTPDETITKGSDDAKARFLRDKLGEALDWMKPLFESDCEREKALKCWDKVFFTKYFGSRLEEEAATAGAESGGLRAIGPAILKDLSSSDRGHPAVQKEGGGRYA